MRRGAIQVTIVLVPTFMAVLATGCRSRPIDRITPVFGEADAVLEESGSIARLLKPGAPTPPKWRVDERHWYYERFGFVLRESATGELKASPMTAEDRRKLELFRRP
ncbi:MAG TPA: hypothetical protein VD997_09035 [Phycisphaerales bacterium]|nr:hypothetical protein [Phycisphaerales bacterium]